MTQTWTLSKIRMRLALRSRLFIFFSLAMPLGFLFFYAVVFGRGNPHAMAYLLAAVLALTVMGGFWGMSMQLVLFREMGILRRFRLAPVGAGALLGSSIVSNFFLVIPTVALEFAISRWVFRMDTWGNLGGTLLLVAVGAATFSSLGLIIASVSNSQQETQVINNVLWFAFLFLSGATLPLATLPGWLQRVALFLPATYLVTGLQGTMLQTASVRVVAEDVLALAACLAVSFEISRQVFRWEPEEKVPGRAKLWVAAVLIPFLLFGAWEAAYGHRLQQVNKDFQALQERPAADSTR